MAAAHRSSGCVFSQKPCYDPAAMHDIDTRNKFVEFRAPRSVLQLDAPRPTARTEPKLHRFCTMNPAHCLLLTRLSAMTKSCSSRLTRCSRPTTQKSSQQSASVRNQGYCQGSLRLLTSCYMLGQTDFGSSPPVALSSSRLSPVADRLAERWCAFVSFHWL